MKIQKISILGCGWLGLPLAEKLLREGYEVKGSTTRQEKCAVLASKGVRGFCIEAGLTLKGENLSEFFQSDLLILNIPPGRKRSDVATFHPQQMQTIVEKAMECGVKKLIFLSSTSVYGSPNDWVMEANELAPATASGIALQRVENWLQVQEGLEVTILRLAGLVGGERKAGRFLAGKKDLANGDAAVNLVHREDCIAVILKIIETERWGEIYNCCADEHPTRAAFYTYQTQKQGLERPTFLKNGPLSFKIVSNQKIKAALDYQFIYPDPMEF